jgi:eukaryotic-like serine/threonine-protein kinase
MKWWLSVRDIVYSGETLVRGIVLHAAREAPVTVPGYPAAFNGSSRQPPLGPGEELVGKYRVEQVIGAGAMGVVVLAWHIELEQQVAIKFLYPEFAANEHGAERFRREARAAVRIQNEHVARVLDVGTLDGHDVPFIVMEYLEGRDLARELKERRALPPLEAVAYVRQACEAVGEAHALGIVHRDLKPANLFLSRRPSGAQLVKVLDFGISKLVSGNPQRLSITDTSILLGSPAYMSPEQLECSRSVDGRADIWSLGVILYELIAGHLPFNGDSVPQLIRSVITGARMPLVGSDALLSRLEPIVARCLAQERASRFQTAAELSAALEAATRAGSSSRPLELARTSVAQLESTPAADNSPVSAAPALEAPAAENAPPGPTGADGAWGRTHGARRVAWQRHSIPLVALLALIALGSVWGVRSERRALDARAAAEQSAASPGGDEQASERTEPGDSLERVVAPLAPAPQIAPVPPEPTPAVPAPPAAMPPPASPLALPPGETAATVAPRSSPAASPPTAPAALRPALAAAAANPAAPASSPAAPPLAAPPAAASAVTAPVAPAPPPSAAVAGSPVPPPAAKAPAAASPAGAAREVGLPRDERFEIPEFGGRE